jgi:hypothetical protein
VITDLGVVYTLSIPGALASRNGNRSSQLAVRAVKQDVIGGQELELRLAATAAAAAAVLFMNGKRNMGKCFGL